MLHVNEYMLLMLCGLGEGTVMVCGLVSCAIVVLLLKVTLTFVFLNRLIVFLRCGKECEKVAHFLSCMEAVGKCGWSSFFCIFFITPTCSCGTTAQTLDHLLSECELLNKERDNLISTVLKTDVWPISKNSPIRKHFKIFAKFTNKIFDKLNEV